MFKRLIAIIAVICVLCGCAAFAAAQDEQNETGVISVKLNSDITGLTNNDVKKLIELKSDNVVLSTRRNSPVSISDYAGTPTTEPVKAGRTYYISYSLTAAEGYTLPEELHDGDVVIECGKGVTVYSTQLVSANIRDENDDFHLYRGLVIRASVVVDGNAFQRVIGFVYDLILKIKAWSLY